MNPDLDKRSGYIVNESLKNKSLGLINDDEIKYADLYEDFNENKKSIMESNVVAFDSIVLNAKPKIIDIRPILATDSERFVDAVYAKLLGRKPEEEAVNNANDLLKSGTLSKLDYIKNVASSDECKKRNIVVTGFSNLSLNDFLKYEGKEFIDMSYIYILGRLPDESGRRNILRIMKLGEITKVEVIHDLLYSLEGQDNRVTVEGLDEEYAKIIKSKKIYSKPVIGKIAKFLNSIAHVNARVNYVIEDMMEMDALIEKNSDIFSSHINDIQIQLCMLNCRVDRLKKIHDNLSSGVMKDEEMLQELGDEIKKLSTEMDNLIHRIDN